MKMKIILIAVAALVVGAAIGVAVLVLRDGSTAAVPAGEASVEKKVSFSFECYEPNLAVYDKLYKNMGFGKGIFSWCVRPRQKK